MWAGRAAAAAAATLMAALFVVSRMDRHAPVHIREVRGCARRGWRDAPRGRKIFDAFVFNMELDILEVRLRELRGHVDRFVVVEAPFTHAGAAKPLYFERSKERFAGFPITHHVAPRPVTPPHLVPGTEAHNVFLRTANQNAVHAALVRAGARPDDLVVISDVDEIPRGEVVAQLKKCDGYATPAEIESVPYIYDFGCREEHAAGDVWRTTRVLPFRQYDPECDGTWDGAWCTNELRKSGEYRYMRFRAAAGFPETLVVPRGGVHMSYFMSTELIMTKLASNSEAWKRDRPEINNRDHIECLVSRCVHPNLRDHGTRHAHEDPEVPIGADFGAYSSKNPAIRQFYSRTIDRGACAREARAGGGPG